MPAETPLKTSVRRDFLSSSGSLLLLLMISGLGILGLVALAAVWAGTESDAAALDRQRLLVGSRLRDQVQKVSQEIQLIGAGYTSLLERDARAGAIDTKFSDTLPMEAFGETAKTVFGYDGAYLVTSSGDLALRADPETARRLKWLRPLLFPMLRDLESQRLSASSQAAQSSPSSRVELLRLEGRPSIAGIVSVTDPQQANGQDNDQAGAHYLIAFRFLDGVTLDKISREQGLGGARYARTSDQEQNEVAYQIDATSTGEPIGFIIWQPDLPGSRVISRLVPVLSGAALVIAILFLSLAVRLRRSLAKLSASEQHARHLSVHDVLTGLPNRGYFNAALLRLLAGGHSSGNGAVALIDLDRFKEVNDTYGHAAGDELLRSAVARISALVRAEDVFARLGGDEFALLFAGLESDDTFIEICNGIIESLAKPFQLEAASSFVRIGSSIGVSVFRDPHCSASEHLRRADVALYEAKNSGRGKITVFAPSLDDLNEARDRLRTDLRLVLEDSGHHPEPAGTVRPNSAGRLEVFYQSVHRSIGSNALSGAEALVRWRHPKLGLLSPNDFIPIAEEAGLIDRLGEWVLRTAAAAATSWPKHLTISVNVSPSQIRRHGFDQLVLSIVAEHGLSASQLELELTEAALFGIDVTAQENLARLRSSGVRIALDDFGTGYSSLSHLLQLNTDRIKIDRSFVSLLGTKAEGAAIVSAILDLSRRLGKDTTAEGVETEGQRDFLVAAGCSDLQGYLFSRPMPLDEFLQRTSLTMVGRDNRPGQATRR